MRTATEFLPTLAVTTLGAVATMMAAGPSVGADAGAAASVASTACHALSGSHEERGFGGWYCTHPARTELYEPTLAAVCLTTPSAHVIDDRSTSGSVGFYCPPPLIS